MTQHIRLAIVAAIAFCLGSCSKGPKDKLIGEWGATAGTTQVRMIFERGNRMTAIEGTRFSKGRYKADFSKTPAVLEFYDDLHPEQGSYCLIELAGDNTLRASFASSQLPKQWEPERTIILERKQADK